MADLDYKPQKTKNEARKMIVESEWKGGRNGG